MAPDERPSDPSLDDLDAGWGDDEEEELEAIEAAEPEPPGLTPEEHQVRLAARKDRARAKAAAKKERRKARAAAAAGKRKTKQKRAGSRAPVPEGSAPSLRGVATDAETADTSGDAPALTVGAAAKAIRPVKAGLSRATMIAIAAIVAVVAAAAAYAFRK